MVGVANDYIPIDDICIYYLYLLYPHISQFIVPLQNWSYLRVIQVGVNIFETTHQLYCQSPYIPYPNYILV